MGNSVGGYFRCLEENYSTTHYGSTAKEEIVRLFGLVESGVITNKEFDEMAAEQICSAIVKAGNGTSDSV
jgi:hypothetical protein